MDHLGTRYAPLVGQSLSGMVSMSVAIQYPQRISEAVVEYFTKAGHFIMLEDLTPFILRESWSELGLTEMVFRLLPSPTRLKVGSEALVGPFNQFTDQRVRLEVNKKIHLLASRALSVVLGETDRRSVL